MNIQLRRNDPKQRENCERQDIKKKLWPAYSRCDGDVGQQADDIYLLICQPFLLLVAARACRTGRKLWLNSEGQMGLC